MKSFNIIACLLLALPEIQAWVVPTPSTGRITTQLAMNGKGNGNGPGGGRQSKKIVDDMVDFINEPVTSGDTVDQSFVDEGPPQDDELAPIVRTIVKAADMRKSEGIVAIRISKVSTVAGFVVICTGNSRPQNQAIAAAIKEDVETEFGGEWTIGGNGVPEGNADSGWILLDYGDVIVHVMTPKSRLFYDIEGQWREKGGEYMNLDDVLLPNGSGEEQAQLDSTMTGISEEDDPFWS
jgi:ribosome-associated protein